MATKDIISKGSGNGSPDGEPLSNAEIQAGFLPIGYEGLIRQYGDAMARIGHLEAQLSSLSSTINTSEFEEIAYEIPEDSDSQDDANIEIQESGILDEEVAQMRLQLSSLAAQLTNAQDELRRHQGPKIRRRTRNKKGRNAKQRFWKTWARQLTQAWL